VAVTFAETAPSLAQDGASDQTDDGASDPANTLPDDLDDLDDIESELDETTDELEDAATARDQALARVAEAERELAAIESRLTTASAELAEAREAVTQARDAADEAQAEADEARERAQAAADEAERAEDDARDAERRLEEARTALRGAVEAEHEADAQLQDRAIGAFKHGGQQERFELAGALLGAGDWHEVGLAVGVIRRALDEDRRLVRSAERARDDASAARSRAEDAEVEAQRRLHEADRALAEAQDAEVVAIEAAEVAAGELARAQAAEDEHAGIYAGIQDEQAQRQAIYVSLEEDAAAREALAQRLEERLAALETAALEARREPSEPPSSGETLAWAHRLPAAGEPWAEAIATAAATNGLDPRLLAALVWSESAFNPEVESWVGAIGLAQLMPGTAAWLGVDPWDPEENLDGGARYLAAQIDRFDSVELGLAAYNAGPNAVVRYGGIPPYAETQNYVPTVLERYQYLAGG